MCTQIHPALETVLGKWLEHDSVLEVIAAWPTPARLRKAGRARIDAKLKSNGCRRHAAWAQAITDALARQSVVVAGTDAAGVVLPHPTPAGSSPCTPNATMSPPRLRP